VESAASRGNGEAVILPLNPGVAGVDDYFGLVDLRVHSLGAAFGRATVVVAAGSAP
jgi:hypothetical protein